MSIKIIAVGKKHDAWVESGIKRYQVRLKPPFDVKWDILSHSALNEASARQDESERLLKRLSDRDYVILLDERGENLPSPALAAKFEHQISHGQQIVLLIGGAYGVDEAVRSRADFIWSLSSLVFPHQLVRLMLIEQIYRFQEITRGSSYHHD